MGRFPLVRILDFVSRVYPFDTLDRDELSDVVCRMQLAYHPRGRVIIQTDGPPSEYLYIIHSGSVKISVPSDGDEEFLVDMRGEGEVFGSVSLLRGLKALFTVTAHEDLLTFMLPGDEFKRLVQTKPQFQGHFGLSLARNIRSVREPMVVSKGSQNGCDSLREMASQMRGRVLDLMSSNVLTCGPEVSIRDAARKMTERRVGSIVITDAEGGAVGLVTDTDLRGRVLAAGLDPETPVAKIMSRPPVTISPGAYAFEAMFEMTRYGVHHLLVSEGGRIQGVVSDHDIKMVTGSTPVGLARNIEKVDSLEEMSRFPDRIRRVLESLLSMGSSAEYMMDLLNEFMDRLFLRLFELCEGTMIEEGLGPPPTQYTWLALGRAGRKEQAPPFRQDFALVFSDVPVEREGQVREWFIGFARRVREVMRQWGFYVKPYENLGIGSEWCRSASDWKKTYEGWLRDPSSAGNGNIGRVFDFRGIQGEGGFVTDLRGLLWGELDRGNDLLIHLARDAALRKTPLGFFRNTLLDRNGGHSDRLDLEKQGIEPLAAAIRVLALQAGVSETNTLDRLRRSADLLSLNNQLEDDLHEAFSFMTILWVSRYLEASASAGEQDCLVNPASLASGQRKILKDCFSAVERFQSLVMSRVSGG